MNKKVLLPRCVTLIINSELSSVPRECLLENNRNSMFRNLSQKILTLYSIIIMPFDTFEISCIETSWEMEHLLFWSKCSIFHNIFKSIQNLT